MIFSSVLISSSLIGLVYGAPYLGSGLFQPLAQPYVYLNSPHLLQNLPAYTVPQHQYQYQYQYVSPSASHHSNLNSITAQRQYLQYQVPSEQPTQINQFHTDDGHGRVLFGFHGHNQARMEARDAQGRVRGSYSYVDPHGQLVRMDYWDDGSGFQARGNNVPKVAYDVPSFTPEVQAARDQHFKLYEQILLSNVHTHPTGQVPVDDYPYVERPDGIPTSPESQNDDDDTVEVGLYPNEGNDLPSYSDSYPGTMRLPGGFQYQFQDEEDRESISLDNPEFNELGRSGKSLNTEENHQEGSNQEQKKSTDMTKKNSEQDKSEATVKKTPGVMETKDKASEEMKKTTEKKIENSNSPVETSESDQGNHQGFSYNIQYTVGTPANAQATNFHKVSSIVASEPVSQKKTSSTHSVHPLPLHTMTGFGQGPSAVHDMQMSPNQVMSHPHLGQMIVKSFPAPVAAVHDSQVPRGSGAGLRQKTESN